MIDPTKPDAFKNERLKFNDSDNGYGFRLRLLLAAALIVGALLAKIVDYVRSS